jgi:hypothetical protein
MLGEVVASLPTLRPSRSLLQPHPDGRQFIRKLSSLAVPLHPTLRILRIDNLPITITFHHHHLPHAHLAFSPSKASQPLELETSCHLANHHFRTEFHRMSPSTPVNSPHDF